MNNSNKIMGLLLIAVSTIALLSILYFSENIDTDRQLLKNLILSCIPALIGMIILHLGRKSKKS